MKKKIILLISLCLAASLCFIVGGGYFGLENSTQSSEKNKKTNTVADMLTEKFVKEAKKSQSIEEVATAVFGSDKIEISSQLEILTVEDSVVGLTGFSDKIAKFEKGYAIRPSVGSIPFVVYILETDNRENALALEKQMNEKADLKWNICTEADNKKSATSGNLVFFVMAPEEF